MKTIAIAILLILFVGFAGAVTIPTPTYNNGHSGGDKFPGPVQVNDLIVDDDAQIGDDAAVLGDLAVTGAISAGTGVISSGVYDGDFRLAANHSFYSTTGSGGIDWSNATGTWKMPTGAGTIAGTTDFNGAITCRNITLDANYNIVTSGTGTITSAATISGEQLTSTDDALITDDLTVDGGARIDESLTANTIAINTTGTFTGIQTFTAAPVFNAGVLIPTGDTINTVDADGVKSGGVIVPQEMVINVPITTSEPDRTVFIADDAWQITKIEEVHATAQNTAYPDTGSVTVTKCTGTQAAASGSVLHNTSMYLNSTVETIQTPTLNAATGALNLADGNRLAINVNGTMTTFANGLITIHMKRI